jgi:hypothetical protein
LFGVDTLQQNKNKNFCERKGKDTMVKMSSGC